MISGETGCGKTTQVPQFVLDAADAAGVDASIVCTQPRRISAIGVAERVAAERGASVGGEVGYQIKLEKRCSADTRLMFCTTGILLRRLQVDSELSGTTHVILDEVRVSPPSQCRGIARRVRRPHVEHVARMAPRTLPLQPLQHLFAGTVATQTET